MYFSLSHCFVLYRFLNYNVLLCIVFYSIIWYSATTHVPHTSEKDEKLFEKRISAKKISKGSVKDRLIVSFQVLLQTTV